jgi:hypothetical protein
MRCGAAVRGHARFCPQCGQDMSEAPTLNRPATAEEQMGTSSSRLVDEAERVARALNESVPPLSADAGNASAPSGHEQLNEEKLNEPAAPEQAPAQTAQAAHDEEASVPSSRLSGVRARAGERVERLREVSVVVFDEAQDDPALRFVLVAVALFVGFLLILLFSQILR